MKQQSESDMLDLKNRERAASMAPIQDGLASVENEDSKPAIDDRGTNQSEAAQILQGIRDAAFDSSNEKLAIALTKTGTGRRRFPIRLEMEQTFHKKNP